jgi:DNA-binding NarL/FixJ family response regulator
MTAKIKIVLIEANRIFRLGLKKLLTDDAIDIVGEAANAATGMDLIRKQQPEVVLLATDLPDATEVSLCDWIHRHFSQTRTLFLLKNADIPTLNRLFNTSATGFLTKDSGYLSVEIIKTIAEGKTYIQPDLALGVIQRPRHAADVLSNREYQVLTLVRQGHTHEAIAEKLRISTKTVFNIKYRGFKKLKIDTVEQLKEIFLNK